MYLCLLVAIYGMTADSYFYDKRDEKKSIICLPPPNYVQKSEKLLAMVLDLVLLKNCRSKEFIID